MEQFTIKVFSLKKKVSETKKKKKRMGHYNYKFQEELGPIFLLFLWIV